MIAVYGQSACADTMKSRLILDWQASSALSCGLRPVFFSSASSLSLSLSKKRKTINNFLSQTMTAARVQPAPTETSESWLTVNHRLVARQTVSQSNRAVVEAQCVGFSSFAEHIANKC